MTESKDALEYLRVHDPVLHKSLTQFDGQHYDPQHYGSVILLDGQEVAHLIRCKHCGMHFANVKNSGRGWCSMCNGPVCPKKSCDRCVPAEAWLEAMEKGLSLDQIPVKAAVHGEVPVFLMKPPQEDVWPPPPPLSPETTGIRTFSEPEPMMPIADLSVDVTEES